MKTSQEARRGATSHSRRHQPSLFTRAPHYWTIVLRETSPRRSFTTGIACTSCRSAVNDRGPCCCCCCYSKHWCVTTHSRRHMTNHDTAIVMMSGQCTIRMDHNRGRHASTTRFIVTVKRTVDRMETQ